MPLTTHLAEIWAGGKKVKHKTNKTITQQTPKKHTRLTPTTKPMSAMKRTTIGRKV